jgi:uncharacterized integral membrane protein
MSNLPWGNRDDMIWNIWPLLLLLLLLLLLICKCVSQVTATRCLVLSGSGGCCSHSSL